MATERVRVLVVGDAEQRDDYLASDDQVCVLSEFMLFVVTVILSATR